MLRKYGTVDQIKGHVIIILNPDDCSLRAAAELFCTKKTTLIFIALMPLRNGSKSSSEVTSFLEVRTLTNFLLLLFHNMFLTDDYNCTTKCQNHIPSVKINCMNDLNESISATHI